MNNCLLSSELGKILNLGTDECPRAINYQYGRFFLITDDGIGTSVVILAQGLTLEGLVEDYYSREGDSTGSGESPGTDEIWH